MKQSRARFKFKLRQCKRDEARVGLRADILANDLVKRNSTLFWNYVSKQHRICIIPASSFVSFTQCSPTCGRMPLPSLSLWPGRQPYRPRLVGDRRGGGPSSVAPRSRNPSPRRCFRTANPCAQSVNSSPAEPVLSRSSRQRLGHLQSHFDRGWHVCQAVFPELQPAAACRRVERRDGAQEALPRLQSACSWLVME